MYEELIRRLREEPLDSNKAALPIMDLCIDAATAIENLSHRLDMAQGERDAVTRHMIELESNDGQVRKALHDKGFDNLDMLFEDYSQVKNELASYKNTGLEPEEINDMALDIATLKTIESMYDGLGNPDHLRDLLQAEQDGKLVELPFVAMVEQSLQDGKMKPMGDQKHNGRYAVVYVDHNKWKSPLIDICGKPYNREEAENRMAALKGGEG